MTLTTVDARAEWRPGMMAGVAAAAGRRAAAVREDVYEARTETRTRSSTASARPRRVPASRWARTATTWNSR